MVATIDTPNHGVRRYHSGIPSPLNTTSPGGNGHLMVLVGCCMLGACWVASKQPLRDGGFESYLDGSGGGSRGADGGETTTSLLLWTTKKTAVTEAKKMTTYLIMTSTSRRRGASG